MCGEQKGLDSCRAAGGNSMMAVVAVVSRTEEEVGVGVAESEPHVVSVAQGQQIPVSEVVVLDFEWLLVDRVSYSNSRERRIELQPIKEQTQRFETLPFLQGSVVCSTKKKHKGM
jgi:hypothetical protein